MAQQGKDTNIMDLLQQFFQNNNTAANKKNENENYYLDHLQIPFTQQQSTSSSILLNHEPNHLYSSMIDYNQPTLLYSPEKQYKFRKNITLDQKQSSSSEPSIDALILTKQRIEQEILKRKRLNDEKQQQEELLLRNKKVKKPQQPQQDEDDEDDEEEEDDEIEGDRLPLSKDDKRRRNTAASARFRVKKKMREQALQKTAYEMTEKAGQMEQRAKELELEIKWLRALVVEKNEAKIKQLIKERPLHSIAFPVEKSSKH